MTILPGISLYNQDRLSDEDFVDNFVARGETVELLLNILRHAAAGGETEHQVLIGPRGMGKTSMLRRVAIGLGRDAILGDCFVPLRFREEQYNVISMDAFWRNCGEALAEWCEAHGHEVMAGELDRAIDGEEWRDPDAAAKAFLGFCHRLARRPCLFLDNLDLVLDGLSDWGWQLRHVLQRTDGPFVVGAATQPLPQAADRDDPFYEFFHPIYLEPLTEHELMRCMHALADRRGDPGAQVKAVLANSPERVRTLYALTGGNPRILSLIYLLLEKTDTETVFGDLEALLDQVTPFYKARIEEFQGAQQRAIIDGIALNWDPITSSALSEVTGIEVTTISSQLARLKRDGFVEQVPTSGTRDGYQLSERFLNIWYLMRHGTRKTKQRLRWLAIFLSKLFSGEELGEMALQARDESRGPVWHPDFREAVIEAYETAERRYDSALAKRQQVSASEEADDSMARDPGLAVAESMLLEARVLSARGNHAEAIRLCDDVATRLGGAVEASPQALLAKALVDKGLCLYRLHRFEEEVALYEDVLDRFATATATAVREQVAISLHNKAFTLRRLGRVDEALRSYEEICRRFRGATELPLKERVGAALVDKGVVYASIGDDNRAIATFDEAISLFSDAAETSLQERAVRALVNKGVSLSLLGRDAEAISLYDEVDDRFGQATDSVMQEGAARALVNKGISLGRLGQDEDAMAVYDEAVRRFEGSSESAVQVQIGTALLGKAAALIRLNRPEQALAACEEVQSRAGSETAPWLAARALVEKGAALAALSRNHDAIATYDEVVRRFASATKPQEQQEVVRALLNKGIALENTGRSEEAIATYDEVANRSTDPYLLPQVARALMNKASALGASGRRQAEIEAYDEVLARFGGADQIDLQSQVVRALVNKGNTLSQLERDEDAVAAYEEASRRFGTLATPEIRETIARASLNKGIVLARLERHEAAVAAYDDVVSRFEADPDVGRFAALALLNKGVSLGRLGRNDDAVAVYEDMTRRFKEPTDPTVRSTLAKGLLNKGFYLKQLNRFEEAIAEYDETVARFGNADEAELRETVGAALSDKGRLLDQLDRHADAIAVYEEIVNRFVSAKEPSLRERAADALGRAGRLLFHAFGQDRQAEAYYRRALAMRPDRINSANLVWSLIAQKRIEEAEKMRDALVDIDREGMALIEAAIQIVRDNLGLALQRLGEALEAGLDPDTSNYFEDVLWLLRIGTERGHGERLIEWFSTSGHADRYAPIYGALLARVRGEKALLDLNPEVRPTASQFYRVISVGETRSPADGGGRKRGRPRRG